MTPRRGNDQRGYTVVELMMAIAVMTIGLGGIIAMQKVTVASNMNAKNVAVATHVAQGFLDELSAESHAWNQTNGLVNTVWLQNVGAQGSAPAWFAPAYNAGRKLGQGFDALGNPVLDANLTEDGQYCVHLRLTWLAPTDVGKQGGGLIRAEARVYWRREGIGFTADSWGTGTCVSPEDFANWAGSPRFHTLYMATAIRQGSGS